MDHEDYDDAYVLGILENVETIAMVGASANTVRPSYFVLKYLMAKGYTVIPVNPGLAGKKILGRKVYASLADIPEQVDMVDIFRNSEAALEIAKEAVAIGARVVWMQLGVSNAKAARYAEKRGLKVVMNRCPKIEYGRFSGEIGWAGVNSGTVSAKRGQLMAGFQHRGLSKRN